MSTITAHVYTVPTPEFFGGYRDPEGGFYRARPGTPTATYYGGGYDTQDIVAWGKAVANEEFGEGGWTISDNGHRIEPVKSDTSRPMETLEFYQGIQIIDLSEYAHLLESEDEEDEEDEDEDTDFGNLYDVEADVDHTGSGGNVLDIAARRLIADIVRDVPNSEAGLTARFRRYGLLS